MNTGKAQEAGNIASKRFSNNMTAQLKMSNKQYISNESIRNNKQSYSPLSRKLRESEQENAYFNRPNKGLLPFVTKAKIRESYDPNYDNLKTFDGMREMHNTSFITWDNDMRNKSRNSIICGEHSFENYIK